MSAKDLIERGAATLDVWPVARDGVCTCRDGIACSSPGKHPRDGAGWMKRAMKDRHPERRVRRVGHNASYGIIPKPGSRLIGIDLDRPEDFPVELIPPTFTVARANAPQGKGHYWLALPDGVDEDDVPRVFAAGEVAVAASRYLVGPGSVHASGAEYEDNGLPIATATPELIEALRASEVVRRAADGSVEAVVGSRHDWLVGQARNLAGLGWDVDRIADELRRLNAEKCSPPLTEREAEFERMAGWAAEHFDADPPIPTVTRVKRERHVEWDGLFFPLSEVPDGKPEPLLLGFLEPKDHTILFGDGGTGKGVIAAWWVAGLTKKGYRVAILDYEAHAIYEWKPRLVAMGAVEDNVAIAQPTTEPIWDIAERVRDELRALDVDYLVVDSVTYACLGQEVEKATTAVRYSTAIATIGLPTLSLAHTTKVSADSPHPFGSIFWSNGARLTINVVRQDDARLVQAKKVNGRPPFAPVLIDWEWAERLGPSEVPHDLTPRAAKVPTTARISSALADGAALTVPEIAAVLAGDGLGDAVKETAISAALSRGDGFESDGRKPARWRLYTPTITRSKRVEKGVEA